ncbi:hypothetical protein EPUS_01425 [Endocarpon pusillum Z07020]|uniref:Uncharacterized protein n=1 Tax=Endocarpon pusillum (strain Z07020 / HMAS-L-300199) TaxID=1263415 RepID=U1GEN3_ENDPU|nr:uncharacterized protein EPUS_01425 [Endocarpon pusillum Z07020]ERF76092.1 hypothetical protein EPUS_01425 [Endocarpon pusillum Z07020]
MVDFTWDPWEDDAETLLYGGCTNGPVVRCLKTPYRDRTVAKVAHNDATDYEMLLFERGALSDSQFRKTIRAAQRYFMERYGGELEVGRLSAAVTRVREGGHLPPRGPILLEGDAPPRTARYPYNQSDLQIEEVKVHLRNPARVERWFRCRVQGGNWQRCGNPDNMKDPNPAPASTPQQAATRGRAAAARRALSTCFESPAVKGETKRIPHPAMPSPAQGAAALLGREATPNVAAREGVENPRGSEDGAARLRSGSGGPRNTNLDTAWSAGGGLSKCFGGMALNKDGPEEHRLSSDRPRNSNGGGRIGIRRQPIVERGGAAPGDTSRRSFGCLSGQIQDPSGREECHRDLARTATTTQGGGPESLQGGTSQRGISRSSPTRVEGGRQDRGRGVFNSAG